MREMSLMACNFVIIKWIHGYRGSYAANPSRHSPPGKNSLRRNPPPATTLQWRGLNRRSRFQLSPQLAAMARARGESNVGRGRVVATPYNASANMHDALLEA